MSGDRPAHHAIRRRFDMARPTSCGPIYYRGDDLGAASFEVPRPVPMVSPVVPVLLVPLLTPLPGFEAPSPRIGAPTGLVVAGETAESPVVTVDPVLAFCANTIVAEKINPTAAIAINFMLSFLSA
jgi:hypothetical protein